LPKEEKLKAFQVTVDHINRRLDALFAMDAESMTRPELIAAINKISEIE
jgi:arsenate reductase